MKKIKPFESFLNENDKLYHSDLERLAGFYEGDKYVVRITEYDDENKWYTDYVENTFVVVDDERENKWKVVPIRLHAFFGIKGQYTDYYTLPSGVLYIDKDDCEIEQKL